MRSVIPVPRVAQCDRSGSRRAVPGRALLLVVIALLAGCATQRPLMPTPNVYASKLESPYAEMLPEGLEMVPREVPSVPKTLRPSTRW